MAHIQAPEVARLRRCVGRSQSSGRAPARGVVVRVHPRRDTGAPRLGKQMAGGYYSKELQCFA